MTNQQRYSLLLKAPQQLGWVSEDLPSLQPHEVLLRTRAGAISMGTEMPHYQGNSRHTHQRVYPYMIGYESVGEVIACGSAVMHLHVGDRVVAFYGHRTYANVPAEKVILVPDDIPDEVALLAILTCDTAKGIHKVAPQPDEPVLITGAGTIGLCSVFMLKALGIHNVDVVEPQKRRCVLAQQLGAIHAEQPERFHAHVQHGYCVGLECSSRNAAFALLQTHMAQQGRLCVLADGNLEPLILTPAFHEKELSITGSSDGLNYQKHARWLFQQDKQRLSTLAAIFDYQTTASALISTFAGLANRTLSATKVFVRYEQ